MCVGGEVSLLCVRGEEVSLLCVRGEAKEEQGQCGTPDSVNRRTIQNLQP